MLDYSDFKIWLDKNDCLNKNFSLMQEVVTEYLLRKFEDPWEHCDWPSVICRELPTVTSRCDEITYNEVLYRGLAVMDSTATSLSMDNKIPIIVFALKDTSNVKRVLMGEKIGTVVKAK